MNAVSKVEFRVDRDWHTFDSLSFRAMDLSDGHSPEVFDAVMLKTQREGEEIRPFMTLKENECQGLMDALWTAGIRPTEGHGSTGQLAATEKHLSDMRAIAFKELGIIKQGEST